MSALAIKLPPPPSLAKLAGTWVGPDESGSVLKLSFDRNGVGQLLILDPSPNGITLKLKVTISKERNSYKLSFYAIPVPDSRDEFTLSGSIKFGGSAIELVEHYPGFDWFNTKALLIRESSLRTGLHGLGSKVDKPHANGIR